MKAVILAAGMGMRLREHHTLPKGFIRINDKTIIEESITLIREQGIQDILIVTGYGAEHYQQLAANDANIATINNPLFASSGSLYSLYCAKDWINDSFLLLESDLLYEKHALATLCKTTASNAILLSGATHSNDEVYVEARNDYLVNMSKDIKQLIREKVLGEFVGINKLSLSAYEYLLSVFKQEEFKDTLLKGHYETDGLVELAKMLPIRCLKIPNLLWCEIDNGDHLENAKHMYSQIRTRQRVTY